MERHCSLKAVLVYLSILLIANSCSEYYKHHPVAASCSCPITESNRDSIPQTIANLSGDMALAVCGYANRDSDLGAITYSGFSLSDCRSHKIIYSWSPDEHCTIEMDHDTLMVKDMLQLALSPNMDWVVEPWLTEKFYNKGGNIYRSVFFDTQLHYNPKQLRQLYSKMDSATWKRQSDLDNNKILRMMRFASQLMIASISGDTAAKVIFYRFRERLQPHGKYAVWYAQLEKVLLFSKHKDSLVVKKIY